MISQGEVVLRLILSAIIGSLIGIEREVNNRPAGLRTHILVSVGSTLIMLVSIDGFYSPNTGLPIGDPARLASQVVSGIGFLGAGTIMRTGNNIKGLTTAASLWVCGGIGLAIGGGYYLGAFLTVGIVLLTLMSLGLFEEKVFRAKYKTMEVISENRPGLIGEIGTLLGQYDVTIKNISISNTDLEGDYKQNENLEMSFLIKIPNTFNTNNFVCDVHQIDGIFKTSFDGEAVTCNYFIGAEN